MSNLIVLNLHGPFKNSYTLLFKTVTDSQSDTVDCYVCRVSTVVTVCDTLSVSLYSLGTLESGPHADYRYPWLSTV